MRNLLLVILILFSCPLIILGQQSTKISGTITDKQGSPLPRADIIIPILNLGAASDNNGKYAFTVPAKESKGQRVDLTVKYVGYKSKTVSITLSGGNITKNFSLEEDIFKSEEVVVTGLASKTSKSRAEVSVSRVNAADLTNTSSFQTMSQLVEGQISGVQVSSPSGNAGVGFRFYVRGGGGINGDEQPVIYIDGVRANNLQVIGYYSGGQETSVLSTLDPENIANIQVLKGPAAAAMYGTSGSNGVVLITTKSGSSSLNGSRKLSVNYKFTYGLNAQSYKYKSSDFLTANAANAIFRTGVIRQNNLNVSGGSNLLRYYGSFDDRYEQGNIPNNDINRKALRLNLTSFTTSNLTIKVTSQYSLTNISRPDNNNDAYGFLTNTLSSPKPYSIEDSVAVFNASNKNKIESFTGGIKAIYTPIKNLEIYFNGGIDNSNYRQDNTYPYLAGNPGETGFRAIFNDENRLYTYDFNAEYSYNILSDLQVKSVVGAQLFDRYRTQSWINTTGFNTTLITDIGAGSNIIDYGEYLENRREAGIYTEHNLVFKNKYFLTLGLRKDYASSIGQEAPSIVYPKVSAAIRLDKFDWFPFDAFGLFKVRAAYGENGQLPDLLAPVSLYWGAVNGGYGPAAVIYNIGNPSIKPERIKEFETGFELEFLKDFSVEFTYYRQNATNSIVYMLPPPSTGLTESSVPYNVGGIKNHGFETHLQASLIRSKDFGLSLSLIWNYQHNVVTDLGGAEPFYDHFGINVIKVGLPKHEFYAQKVMGANFKPDGTYDGPSATKGSVDLGNPIPNHTGSFSIKFRFLKNFNVYALAEWALNRKMYNITKQIAESTGNVPEYNILEAQLGLTPDHPEISRLTPGTQEYIDAANKIAKLDYRYPGNFIEDAAYFKIGELSLSYSLKDLLSGSGFNYLKNITIGISALNVWTLTNYSGADVESNYTGIHSLSRGIDLFTLQHPRVYNFWVGLAM